MRIGHSPVAASALMTLSRMMRRTSPSPVSAGSSTDMEPVRNPGESAMSNCARRAESNHPDQGAGDIVATVVWQNIYSDAGAGLLSTMQTSPSGGPYIELAAIASPRPCAVGPPPEHGDGSEP